MAESGFTEAVLDSPTGAKLAIYTRAADIPARGIVHINHGLAECASRYAPFADYLASRGYHAIAQDHRGHGHTTAEDGGARRFADKDGWNKVIADALLVQNDARKDYHDLPLVLMGHSMGSYIAQSFVMRHPQNVSQLISQISPNRYMVDSSLVFSRSLYPDSTCLGCGLYLHMHALHGVVDHRFSYFIFDIYYECAKLCSKRQGLFRRCPIGSRQRLFQ